MKAQQNFLDRIPMFKYVDVGTKSFWKLPAYPPCTQKKKKLFKFCIADLHFLVALLNFLIFICALKQQYREAE